MFNIDFYQILTDLINKITLFFLNKPSQEWIQMNKIIV